MYILPLLPRVAGRQKFVIDVSAARCGCLLSVLSYLLLL